MLSWLRRDRAGNAFSTDPQQLLIQSERCFTSLTCVVSALLARSGRPMSPDIVAGRTGDCFSLQWSPDDWATGIAGPARDLEEALRDLGLGAHLAAGGAAGDPGTRLMVVVRSSLSNNRSVMVCGGWPPLIANERDWQWGLVNAHDGRGAYLGDTMRDALVHNQQGAGVTWPHYLGQPSAVYRIDPEAAITDRPGKMARRAMQRAVDLLRGEGSRGGVPDLDRLVQWLQEGAPSAGRRCPYPYPKRVAARCQFEAQARFLEASARVAPHRKSAAIREVARIAAEAAAEMASSEPPRRELSAEELRSGASQAPWEPSAWDMAAAALATEAEAREREVALLSSLRGKMLQIADALWTVAED